MGCVRCVAQAASRQTGGREGSRRPVTALGTCALAGRREKEDGGWRGGGCLVMTRPGCCPARFLKTGAFLDDHNDRIQRTGTDVRPK